MALFLRNHFVALFHSWSMCGWIHRSVICSYFGIRFNEFIDLLFVCILHLSFLDKIKLLSASRNGRTLNRRINIESGSIFTSLNLFLWYNYIHACFSRFRGHIPFSNLTCYKRRLLLRLRYISIEIYFVLIQRLKLPTLSCWRFWRVIGH